MKLRIFYGVDDSGSPNGFYWPSSEQKRNELLAVKRLSPAAFQSVYQCNPGAREGGIFNEDDFSYYVPPLGLVEGIHNPNVLAFCRKGHTIIQAWDTAWDAQSQNDPSCCVTGLLVPCESYHRNESVAELGECEFHFDLLILDVYLEKLTWAQLGPAFKRQWMRWLPEAAVIEKKQSGIGLIQSMQSMHNIVGVSPQDSKRARVLQGIGAGTVQGWFQRHRVLLPYGQSWIKSYKRELKDFTGDKSAKDDQVDATVHLTQHAIDLAASCGILPSEWAPERVDEMMTQEPAVPMPGAGLQAAVPGTPAEFLSFLGALPSLSVNPFGDTCAGCSNHKDGWCRVQKRRVIALDSCPEFKPNEAA